MSHTYSEYCNCHNCWLKHKTELEHAVGCDCSDCCIKRIAARKEKEAAIAEHFADRPEEYVALFQQAEFAGKNEELLQKAKEAGASLAHYANSRDRLLDSLIETNSYLIKLQQEQKFSADLLIELMRINTINHATIMKEIR